MSTQLTNHVLRAACSQAVPFLYELRALLDWTCSATSLNWYQWLKLEDIRASLFVEECRWGLRSSTGFKPQTSSPS